MQERKEKRSVRDRSKSFGGSFEEKIYAKEYFKSYQDLPGKESF
jgi:hypothetical protein